jgi:signal transduction histidine kinase
MLTALNEAALAISEGLSLPRTLQRIADTARSLAQTRYAALGVLEDEGPLLKQFITSGIEPQIARHIHHEPRGRGLLGDVFREGKPIRVERIQDNPRSAGFCDNHPIMTSFIGVPITNRGKHIGNLYLCDRLDGNPFDDQDEEILTLLAAHAAIAIENAHLHEELQAAALRSERDRIGMELHDGVIQSIFATGMKLEILRSRVHPTPEVDAQFQTILEDLNRVIDDIRAYIRNLLSAQTEQPTLNSHIENTVAHFRDFAGISGIVDIDEGLPHLTDFQRHNVLQIIREALANVARHADATEVRISIYKVGLEISLTVQDNGQGFDVQAVQQATEGHFGLRNMIRRAKQLGGNLEIDAVPGQGTTVYVRFPVTP